MAERWGDEMEYFKIVLPAQEDEICVEAKLYYTSFWDKFGMNINYFGMHPKT